MDPYVFVLILFFGWPFLLVYVVRASVFFYFEAKWKHHRRVTEHFIDQARPVKSEK
ncbi:MAG: hypothetical protein MN733_43415 [Nitrososphaera sp.]|nr:hypothetical protein [Nitrososphaera sp.]